MSEPAPCVCYADRARQLRVEVVENVRLACETYRLRFRAPEIARRFVPGQFLMVRLPDTSDPLLGRPLALYDTVVDQENRPVGLDIVYLVVGKATRLLATLAAGSPLEVWGPLGNGFSPAPAEHLLMVAGGIGQTPFMALAREFLGLRAYGDPPRGKGDRHRLGEAPFGPLRGKRSQSPSAGSRGPAGPSARVTLCYGARTAQFLAGIEDFERLGVEVRVSTDDGSAGHHGLVTELIEPVLDACGTAAPGCGPEACRMVVCGPERMMAAAAEIARRRGIACQVSLESPMACGIGACFSCVAKVRDDSGQWDYRRTCVEGPVFDAEQVEF